MHQLGHNVASQLQRAVLTTSSHLLEVDMHVPESIPNSEVQLAVSWACTTEATAPKIAYCTLVLCDTAG